MNAEVQDVAEVPAEQLVHERLAAGRAADHDEPAPVARFGGCSGSRSAPGGRHDRVRARAAPRLPCDYFRYFAKNATVRFHASSAALGVVRLARGVREGMVGALVDLDVHGLARVLERLLELLHRRRRDALILAGEVAQIGILSGASFFGSVTGWP
jgi:hypothetical protein